MILKGEEILFLFSNSIVSTKKLKECNKFPPLLCNENNTPGLISDTGT